MMSETNFSYDTFDRQTQNLLRMTMTVMDGWEDYASTEMNMDLKSLTIKASKVCFLADQDRALQSENLIQERKEANHALHLAFSDFVSNRLNPFVCLIIQNLRDGQGMKGGQVTQFAHNSIHEVLPMIASLIEAGDNMEALVQQTAALEKVMKKEKPVVFPGMTDVERFWLLYEFYTLMCYLLLHFQTMDSQTHTPIQPEDAGRLLLAALQQYAQSEAGTAELSRSLEALRFDHSGQLTTQLLQEARIALRQEIPTSLQFCFMQHIHDIDALGRALLEVPDKTPLEVHQFIAVVAKWQMLTREMDELARPQISEPDLPNEVFYNRLHDKPISMRELRNRIQRMLPLVTSKNHWFCLWSVLSYHNLIQNTNTEAFARQMLSPEWFGNDRRVLRFTGDTLREYNGYFTITTFKAWNDQSYKLYCQTHGKKKWSPTLCTRFLALCNKMDEAFRGE